MDDGAAAAHKLAAVLPSDVVSLNTAPAAELIALAIGLTGFDAATTDQLSERERRDLTLDVLADLMTGTKPGETRLFILEDLHWVDPTTLELIDRALDRAKSRNVMVMLTARPSFHDRLLDDPRIFKLQIGRLDRSDAAAIARALLGPSRLSTILVDRIVEAADGIPLFVEEIAKTVAAEGEVRGTGKGEADTSIPLTLRDSLMARLDRLNRSKALAQVAACIGREFSYPLVRAVAELEESALQAALDGLLHAEIISQRGVPPHSVYKFKHALLQE